MSENGTNNQLILVQIHSYFTNNQNYDTSNNTTTTTYKTSIGEINYGCLLQVDVIKYEYNGVKEKMLLQKKFYN